MSKIKTTIELDESFKQQIDSLLPKLGLNLEIAINIFLPNSEESPLFQGWDG